MDKTFAVIYFTAGLQLLSLNLGSSVVKYELSCTNPIYSAIAYYKPVAQSYSVTDIDGHVYHVLIIGKQRWLQENLKAAHFSNGDTIPELEYNIDWPHTGKRGDRGATGYPGWCYYERSPQYNYPCGKLYNWYAVADPRNVCPTGWHVPSDSDFQILSDFLGGNDSSGAHMKPIKLWREKDERAADNTSGFNAVPAGIRYGGGSFDRAGDDGADFWSSTGYGRSAAVCRGLYYGGSNFGRHYLGRQSGLSVRCVGD